MSRIVKLDIERLHKNAQILANTPPGQPTQDRGRGQTTTIAATILQSCQFVEVDGGKVANPLRYMIIEEVPVARTTIPYVFDRVAAMLQLPYQIITHGDRTRSAARLWKVVSNTDFNVVYAMVDIKNIDEIDVDLRGARQRQYDDIFWDLQTRTATQNQVDQINRLKK